MLASSSLPETSERRDFGLGRLHSRHYPVSLRAAIQSLSALMMIMMIMMMMIIMITVSISISMTMMMRIMI